MNSGEITPTLTLPLRGRELLSRFFIKRDYSAAVITSSAKRDMRSSVSE